MRIKVTKDFSTAPGPRLIKEGKYSGEEFRTQILLPRVRKAAEDDVQLTIDLDGTSGFGTSFLEEAFGGLIRYDGFRLTDLNRLLNIISTEEPHLLAEINEYFKDAASVPAPRET